MNVGISLSTLFSVKVQLSERSSSSLTSTVSLFPSSRTTLCLSVPTHACTWHRRAMGPARQNISPASPEMYGLVAVTAACLHWPQVCVFWPAEHVISRTLPAIHLGWWRREWRLTTEWAGLASPRGASVSPSCWPNRLHPPVSCLVSLLVPAMSSNVYHLLPNLVTSSLCAAPYPSPRYLSLAFLLFLSLRLCLTWRVLHMYEGRDKVLPQAQKTQTG